ncbi:hypothetical protein B0H11DRAFT_1921425 [Mycena galericulata]|nr:hypothetical protein B0H11DRAFT_1921425 [Mycena galericulata]
MVLDAITAISPFASSPAPPQPLVVSLWATDIHRPLAPVPAAHRDVPKFVTHTPVLETPTPAKTLMADTRVSKLCNLPTVPPAKFFPSGASATPLSRSTAMDDDGPPSPLTDISSDVSDSDQDTTKIARPDGAACVTLSELFPTWGAKMSKVQAQAHIKKLAKTDLDPTATFVMQSKERLAIFYRHMNEEFPFLKEYAKNWATIRLLQAHLKTRRTSHKHAGTRNAIAAVLRTTRSRRSLSTSTGLAPGRRA